MTSTSDPDATDYYSRIGAEQFADPSDVKRLAREALKRYHPDQNDHPKSQSQFRRVKAARDCLTDSTARSAYDRVLKKFGPEDATEAYQRWEARGRYGSPEDFASNVTSSSTRTGDGDSGESRETTATSSSSASTSEERDQTSSQTETTGSGRSTSYSQDKKSTSRANRTGTSNSTSDQSTSRASGDDHTAAGETSHQEHANFGHRQSYNRKTYEAPESAGLRDWFSIEASLFGRELATMFALLVTAGAGLLLTTLITVVLVIATSVVGTVLAVTNAVGSPYLTTEIALTIVLEFGVYVGVLLAAMFLFPLLFDREWNNQLGNRLPFPRRIYLLPTLLVLGATLLFQEGNLVEMLLASSLKPEVVLMAFAVVWPLLHRGVLLLRETSPNHTGESYLDSVGWVLFQAGTGSFLLGLYLLGGQWILGTLDVALEYTAVMKYLRPSLLLLVSGGIAGGTAVLVGIAGMVSRIRKTR